MKTLVLGWGNPLLCDDGVGHRVAEALQDKPIPGDVTVLTASGSSLELLDLLSGYDRAIIVDAIQTVGGTPGAIYRLDARSLPSDSTPSLHGINLAAALDLAERVSLALPRTITVFAVEVADVTTFGEHCTPGVAAAIPECVDLVLRELASR